MQRIWITAALIVLGGCSPQIVDPAPAGEVRPPVLELINGRWFTGGGFQATTMYVVDGVLRGEAPEAVESVIDLSGGYVVPPFGEAHTHRPSSPEEAVDSAAVFLDAGVFYVMNHGNLARYRDELGRQVNQPASIDALFANALIASPQSHGVDLWSRLVGRGAFPGIGIEDLEGDAYVIIESEGDIGRRWPEILETRPDFIKIMVEYSEEYPSRHDDHQYFGRSGLDPILLEEIVALAHDAGLRVSAHIETGSDFHAVVTAGVDIVGHLPGYDIPVDEDLATYRVDPSDAALAAARKIIVVTTTQLSVDRADGDEVRLERMQENQRHNLRLLAEAGVTIAVGSDQYSTNSVNEALNLASLEVFDNATLLNMLSSATPQAIFPGRRIGVLEDGAEASFLVLRRDPIDNLDHIRDITLRVKDGKLLTAY